MCQMPFYALCIVCFYFLTTFNKNECNSQHKIRRQDIQSKPTLITAYYDIGRFPKGSIDIIRTPSDYIRWMSSFSIINNHVIFYTDSIEYAALFGQIRTGRQNITKIVLMPRRRLWPFTLIKEIQQVFIQEGYPSFYPNTVKPDYSAVQHSKYAILNDAIINHYVKTDYVCWIDIGVYRDLLKEEISFHLEIPPQFDDSRIGYNVVYNVNPLAATAEEIFLQNKNWVAGNTFVARVDTIKQFCEIYERAVKYFLSRGLASTDQQVLFAMYTSNAINTLNVSIFLQLYHPDCTIAYYPDRWFYLAYLMYKKE